MKFERKTLSQDYALVPAPRRFVQGAGLLAPASTPLATLAARARDTDEGVTFADGPRPMMKYPGKRSPISVTL